MKQWKKAIGIVLAGVVLLTGIALPKNNAMADGKNYGIQSPRVANGVTTWDKIKFGSYNQEGTFRAEPIKWRVLSVDGDDALLLADQCLDARAYHDEKDEKITWENCTLRKWLNEEFYNTVFTEEEKKAVKETTVVNEDNVYKDADGEEYKVEGGNDTKDKVYLLSDKEASNSTYGFDTEFEKSNTRQAKTSDYVKAKKVNGGDSEGMYCCWWLRSPGFVSDRVNTVYVDGAFGENTVCYDTYGVRPALHINLSSYAWEKSGTVASNETDRPQITATPMQSVEPTATPVVSKKPILTSNSSKNARLSDNINQKKTSGSSVKKKIKLLGVRYKKNTKKIYGKVSISKATVKIKVGKKAYKKASVKGKKFTVKLKTKLKKKTKIVIKVTKKGYQTLAKKYLVK